MSAHSNDAVVTGDAVVLDVQIAQLPVRAVGALIDVTVMFIALFVGLFLTALTIRQFDTAFTAAALILFTVLVLVGYPVIMETTTRGRTLGKMAMGLRVVSDDGSPERFRQALFRALASVVEIWGLTGSPAVISSLLSAKGKRLGDLFAGTVVINERGPRLAPPPPMPPMLAAWASTLQLTGLSADQAELARQFLSRAPDLHPQVRTEMANRITADIVARISPAPPTGTPPQYILAAVLAERHRRELARLQAGRAQAAPMVAPVQPGAPAWPSPPTFAAPPSMPPAVPSPVPVAPAPVQPASSSGFATPD